MITVTLKNTRTGFFYNSGGMICRRFKSLCLLGMIISFFKTAGNKEVRAEVPYNSVGLCGVSVILAVWAIRSV